MRAVAKFTLKCCSLPRKTSHHLQITFKLFLLPPELLNITEQAVLWCNKESLMDYWTDDRPSSWDWVLWNVRDSIRPLPCWFKREAGVHPCLIISQQVHELGIRQKSWSTSLQGISWWHRGPADLVFVDDVVSSWNRWRSWWWLSKRSMSRWSLWDWRSHGPNKGLVIWRLAGWLSSICPWMQVVHLISALPIKIQIQMHVVRMLESLKVSLTLVA